MPGKSLEVFVKQRESFDGTGLSCKLTDADRYSSIAKKEQEIERV